MRETPRRAGKVVRPDSAMPAAILSGSVLSCHPRSCPPPRSGDVSSPCSPLGSPELSGTRRPSPYPDPPLLRGRRRLVATAHPLATQNFLGRDVPAPIQTLHYFGARHQFGTSPALPQPVIKTLKGFQTVAGGKAVRPPPPVPRPQNAQPPPLAEGVGGGDIPASRKPSVPMNRDAPRYRGDETSLTEGASPGRTEPVRTEAQSGHAPFCVLLRGLRAHGSYREARRLRCGAPSPGSMPYA